MLRSLVVLYLLFASISCSKDAEQATPPVVIPGIIFGSIYDFSLTPSNITTPDKGTFLVSENNTFYKVDFNATEQAQSNASLRFASDSILTNDSREFANLGRDAVSYYPVAENEIEILFKDGRKVVGRFDANTSFGGTFGEQAIAQWRDPNDPAKPTQKAKDDIQNLVRRYADKDGPGGENTPVYLFIAVTKP